MYSTVCSTFDRALDEIVAEKKDSYGRRTSKRHSSGSRRSSSGRWHHDKFDSKHGSDDLKVSKRSGKLPRNVRILLANLSDQFNQADLEELVEPYNGKHALVHYNERGEQAGTAQFTTASDEAQKFIKDLRGALIDEKRLKITLIDDVSTLTVGTVRERIKFARAKASASKSDSKLRRTIRGRVNKSRTSDRSGGRPSWDQHDHRDVDEESTIVKTPKSKHPPISSNKGSSKKPTQEELDRQLDEYMKKAQDQQMD